jgi:hypothetical protein
MDHKECALANLINDLVIACKIIRVRFGRFYLLIVDYLLSSKNVEAPTNLIKSSFIGIIKIILTKTYTSWVAK